MSQQIGLWALKNKHILNNHIKEVKIEKFFKVKLKKLGYLYFTNGKH